MRATKVVHICDAKWTDEEIYIGRPRQGNTWTWGNPFTLQSGNRGEVIAAFEHWYLHSNDARATWMRENIASLAGRTLVCFCKPRACHGDVLAKYADLTTKEQKMKLTKRQIYTAGLLAIGAEETTIRSNKYLAFRLPGPVTIGTVTFKLGENLVFLGKAGAFRTGRVTTRSADASRSRFATAVYEAGERKLTNRDLPITL